MYGYRGLNKGRAEGSGGGDCGLKKVQAGWGGGGVLVV